MEIDIKKIEVIDNPRKDFNDERLNELVGSIRTHGILQPLGVVDIADRKGHYELVYGERRLRAAKLAGLKTVPIVLVHLDPGLARLTENLQRHDLNPMEEARAFKQLVDGGKVKAAWIAKEVNKTEMYVQRRLELLSCTQKVQNALREGKIALGHALAIARSKAKDQDAVLKEVISERLDVKSTYWRVSRKSARLKDAIFNRKDCIGCKFNGGEQSILYETGTQLEGFCMNINCYIKKTNEGIKREKAKYEKLKVKIKPKKEVEGLANTRRVYGATKTEIKRNMKKHPEDYVVCLEHDYKGIPGFVVFKSGKNIPKSDSTPMDPKVAEANLSRRITDYKRQLLIRENKKVLNVESVKRMSLHFLIKDMPWDMMNEYEERLGGEDGNVFEAILGMKEDTLQNSLAEQSILRVKDLDNSELEALADYSKLQIQKVFRLTDTFLNLYTIAQLKVLAGELGVPLESKKKTDIIQEILKDKDAVRIIPESILVKMGRGE